MLDPQFKHSGLLLVPHSFPLFLGLTLPGEVKGANFNHRGPGQSQPPSTESPRERTLSLAHRVPSGKQWQLVEQATYLFGCSRSWLRHVNSQLQQVESNSLTRDRTQAPCIGSLESYPLNHQGRPEASLFKVTCNCPAKPNGHFFVYLPLPFPHKADHFPTKHCSLPVSKAPYRIPPQCAVWNFVEYFSSTYHLNIEVLQASVSNYLLSSVNILLMISSTTYV